MYYRDHAPPHFHAIYGSEEVEYGIRPGRVLKGKLPRRALSLVREWARLHERELLEAWERARRDAPLPPNEPLR